MSSPQATLGSPDDRRTFGAGRDDPYEHALRRGHGRLQLHGSPAGQRVIEVSRYANPADQVDLRVLTHVHGPMLDVGCGPGRMIAAARRAGIEAIGVDVSAAAVALASRDGLPVLQQSVFEPLPAMGEWGTVLLLDGNLGIGGNPDVLLKRCAELVMASGCIIVEVDLDPTLEQLFTGVLTDDHGASSAPFPWADLGADVMTAVAAGLGLIPSASWSTSGRTFLKLTFDPATSSRLPAHGQQHRGSDE